MFVGRGGSRRITEGEATSLSEATARTNQAISLLIRYLGRYLVFPTTSCTSPTDSSQLPSASPPSLADHAGCDASKQEPSTGHRIRGDGFGSPPPHLIAPPPRPVVSPAPILRRDTGLPLSPPPRPSVPSSSALLRSPRSSWPSGSCKSRQRVPEAPSAPTETSAEPPALCAFRATQGAAKGGMPSA